MPVIKNTKKSDTFKERVSWLEAAKKQEYTNSEITENLCDELCDLVRQGAYLDVACEALGISPGVVYKWIAKGSDRSQVPNLNPLYKVFAKEVKRAEAEKEIRVLNALILLGEGKAVASEKDVIQDDGSVLKERTYRAPSWQAAAWFLERKYPHRYAKITRLDANINVRNMTDSDLEAQIEDLIFPLKKLPEGQNSNG